MRRRLIAALACVTVVSGGFGLLAGGALAAGSTASESAAAAPARAKPRPQPTRHPATPAIKATARIYLYDAFFVHHQTVEVPGRALPVTGYVRPYVPDQHVTLKAYLGAKLVSTHRLRIRPLEGGHTGRFTETVTAPGKGILHLVAAHARSRRLLGFSAGRTVNVLAPVTSSGLFASLVQQRLAKLHFYIPQTGVWDQQTALAIDAYHRLLGRGTSPVLDPAALTALLDGRGAFAVRYPRDGKHVEGDLGDQLLALIQGAKVQAIYPISSGKPSTPTILGRFRVYLRSPGYLPDGMYYSDFFIRGYAIHGYDPAPDYPASHGCMRLPISDAISVWNWLAIGVRVDVYR